MNFIMKFYKYIGVRLVLIGGRIFLDYCVVYFVIVVNKIVGVSKFLLFLLYYVNNCKF